jgi:hypothetical protein
LLFLFIHATSLSFISNLSSQKKGFSYTNELTDFSLEKEIYLKLQLKAIEAKIFASKNQSNTQFCFLIDMSLPSGKKRFFVYDLTDDSIQNSGLVSHGRCNTRWLEGRRYHNSPGSGCTSPGKYKIGNSFSGNFGLAFKLYGLEKTNNNAFVRYIVLHAHSCVPETEMSSDICQSDGGPTVAPGFLKELASIIYKLKEPVLLWILE